MYLFANDGENHTNNVKQLENMKKALEDLSCRHRQKDEDILFSIVCYSDTNL